MSSHSRALIVAHLPMMYRRARKLCRNRFDADDLFQDAIVRSLETVHQLGDERCLEAWLGKVIHSAFIDMLRRSRRRCHHVELDVETQGFFEEVESASWRCIAMEEVHAAIAKLSDDLRRVYEMFELGGQSYAHIAATLAIPKGTVGTRVFRARKQLRKLLVQPEQAPSS